MNIVSVDRSVEEILNSGSYYKIPRFQRPYSWDKENIDDFWQDTIVDSGAEYFIGSMVVYEDGKSVFGIVDGQQRLTTMTILLASVRDQLRTLAQPAKDGDPADKDFADLAEGLHRLIERPNINNKQEYVLQTDGSYPFLQEGVQRFPPKSSQEAKKDEEEAVETAAAYFREKVAKAIAVIDDDPQLSDAKKRQARLTSLTGIRDKILRLKLIFITVDDEDDAYTIFETLNTRGKDLTVGDLVKNYILSNLKKRNQNVDLARDEWKSILGRFEESQVDISINSFILHSWLSRHEYVSEKKLFKDIKKHIKKADTQTFLDTLSHESRIYREILEPSSRTWAIEELAMRESIEALNTFRVRQALPMVMSVMREREAKTLSAKQVRRALRAIEVFHFAVTAVTSSPSSGGISSMYALHARQLLAATTPAAKTKSISDLISKLKQRLPTEAEFVASFFEIGFSEERSQQKALVQYILRSTYKNAVSGQPIDFSRMTLEHLAGQATAAIKGEDIARIGNLFYVDDDLNNKLANKDFASKKKLLAGQSSVWIDPWILGRAKWGRAEIKARSTLMAQNAYRSIWKMPV